METKSRKYRNYPSLTLPQIQSIKSEQLQVVDINVFEGPSVVTDTSIGGNQSKSSVWLTSFRKVSIKDLTYEDILNQKESEFVELLLMEDFSDSVRNDTTYYLSRLRKGALHKNDINVWFEKLYMTHQDNCYFIIQLFRLMRCFPYDYFYPTSLTLAGVGVHHESDYVKSEALSLLDHWGNADVFNLLNYHEPPETPWLRQKYLAVKESLERYAAIQENRRISMGR